jgi:hypothetical protein
MRASSLNKRDEDPKTWPSLRDNQSTVQLSIHACQAGLNASFAVTPLHHSTKP